VAQTLEQGTYELFGEVLQQGIRPVWGTNWPSVADREGAVRVTLVVGYGASGAALPGDLYAALLRAIRGQFDDKPVPLEQLLINHRIWG
jgi:hypothetical protein